jgi:acyl carrier protein
MMRDLMSELTEVFQDVFEDDELVINRSTTAADVAGWDSLQHVTLILQIEHLFGFRFSSAEVADLKSVGNLHDIAQRRLGAA